VEQKHEAFSTHTHTVTGIAVEVTVFLLIRCAPSKAGLIMRRLSRQTKLDTASVKFPNRIIGHFWVLWAKNVGCPIESKSVEIARKVKHDEGIQKWRKITLRAKMPTAVSVLLLSLLCSISRFTREICRDESTRARTS